MGDYAPEIVCKLMLPPRARNSPIPQSTSGVPSQAPVCSELLAANKQAEVIHIPNDPTTTSTQREKRKYQKRTHQCPASSSRVEPAHNNNARVCRKPPKSVRKPARVVSQTPKHNVQPHKTIEHDEAMLSRFASGSANIHFGGASVCGSSDYDCFLDSSPPENGQIMGNHSLSIALGRPIPQETQRGGFHLIPIASYIPGDHTENIYIPDRFDSMEALMFCGFNARKVDSLFLKWDRMRKPGELIDIAKEHIESTATAKGFNPWVMPEIGEDNFWGRLRTLPPKVRQDLVKKTIEGGAERYAWETDYSTSLEEIGIDVELIKKVNVFRFKQMREETMVSHWVWNWIIQKWEDLKELENRIHEIWQGKNDLMELERIGGRRDSPMETNYHFGLEFGINYSFPRDAQEEMAYTFTAQRDRPRPAAITNKLLGIIPQPEWKEFGRISWEDFLSERMFIAQENAGPPIDNPSGSATSDDLDARDFVALSDCFDAYSASSNE